MSNQDAPTTPTNGSLEPMLTVQDVAKILNLSVNSVRRKHREGLIPAGKRIPGGPTGRGQIRWKADDIRNYIDQLDAGAA